MHPGSGGIMKLYTPVHKKNQAGCGKNFRENQGQADRGTC